MSWTGAGNQSWAPTYFGNSCFLKVNQTVWRQYTLIHHTLFQNALCLLYVSDMFHRYCRWLHFQIAVYLIQVPCENLIRSRANVSSSDSWVCISRSHSFQHRRHWTRVLLWFIFSRQAVGPVHTVQKVGLLWPRWEFRIILSFMICGLKCFCKGHIESCHACVSHNKLARGPH